MTREVIVSRQCMVGPNAYFRPGVGPADEGAVIVSIDFYRPEPDPDMDPTMFPTYWCEYAIRYGDATIYANKECGMDATGALLRAMSNATHRIDIPGFDALDGSGRFGNVIPYLEAIPKEFFEDTRHAGTDPDVTAAQQVIFQHQDGRRVPGRIALGYPHLGYGEHKPSCHAALEGLDEHHGLTLEGDTPFQALQLAMASLATRLRAFIASGGSVLTADGGGEVDLEALLGPLLRDATDTGR